jgi:hypothetical protein
LFAPEAARLALADATLRLDLTGEAPPLGELQPLLEVGGAEPEGEPAGLPALAAEIENVTILAETALGPAEIRVDGALRPEGASPQGAPLLAADLTVQGVTPIAVFGGLLEARGTPQSLVALTADLRFAAEAQGLDGRIVADLADLGAAPGGNATVDLTAGPRAAALLAPLLPRAPTWDEARLTLEVEGGFAGLPHTAALQDWLEGGQLAAALTFTAQQVDWPGALSGGQALIALDAELAAGALTLLPAQTVEAGAAAVAPEPLRALGLPEDLVGQLGRGASLRLLAHGPDTPLLAARRTADGTVLRPALRLALESGPSAAVASLRGELRTSSHWRIQTLDFDEFGVSLSDWTLAGHELVSAGAAGRLTGPPTALDGVFDVAAEFAPELPGGSLGSLTLSWPVALTADLPALTARLDGPLQAAARGLDRDDLRLEALTAALAAELVVDLGRREEAVRLDAPGRLSADELQLEGRRIARLEADLEANRLAWSPVAGATHALEAVWAPLELRVSQNGESLLEAEVAPGRWRVDGGFSGGTPEGAPEGAPGGFGYEGTMAVSEARVTLEDPALRLSGIALEGPLPPAPDQAWDLRARLVHEAETSLLPPLALLGTLEPVPTGYAVAVTGQGLQGAVTAVLQARLNPRAPSLEGSLRLAPVDFAPGGVQPGDLTPLLGSLKDASGRLGAQVRLGWTPAGPTAEAEVALEDLSFGYDGTVAVTGLAGTLDFESLLPPRAPAPQILTARRIEAGLALEDVRADVAVVPGVADAPRLQVVAAEAEALGGKIMLREGLIDPGAGRQEAVVVLDGIDVAQLLALVDAPDVQATGRISGEIPIALEGETVVVSGGRLSAEEPGVLQLTSEAAKRALAQGGKSVELMMQALENFQYEELSVGLDKPAEGTTVLTVKLLGQNPDVLDGQPFDLNVRVETDLAPILLALSQALQLTEGMVERLWRAQQ